MEVMNPMLECVCVFQVSGATEPLITLPSGEECKVKWISVVDVVSLLVRKFMIIVGTICRSARILQNSSMTHCQG